MTEDRHADERFGLVETLDAAATQAGLTLTQLALNFVEAHPAVTSTIIGPEAADQLDDLLTAADVVLDADTLDAVDRVVRPGRDVAGVSHQTGTPVLTTTSLRRR